MFPLRDNVPSLTFPAVTIALIVINAMVFLFEVSLGRGLDTFINTFALVPAEPGVAPLFISMFLHGGWMHLIGNMWYLWIFGDNVEDRLGHGRFILFYLLCGLGAGIVHSVFNASSTVPTIGASGAVAGVLGAYAVSYPSARVRTLIFLFIFVQIVDLPALFVLGLWFLMQFLSGAASLTAVSAGATGGVAWFAHIGGFLIGIALLLLMKPRQRLEYP
jgi:membrane associated rhomboid family serine protease